MNGGTSSQTGFILKRAGTAKFQWVLNSDDSLNAYNYTTSSTSFKISSGGQIGIGKTPRTGGGINLDVAGGIQSTNDSGNSSYINFGQYSNPALSYTYIQGDARSNGYMKFHTNDTERLRINSAGTIGMNAVPPDDAPVLFIKGRTNNSSGYACIMQSTSSNLFYIRNDGYGFLLASSWAYGSDIRLKENISDVINGMELVNKLKPKHFDYINGTKNNLGFIAQEVQKLIPQAVSISDEKTGMLALKTDFIVPYLVKAVQELKSELDQLKAK
jgi:hypothetical protein